MVEVNKGIRYQIKERLRSLQFDSNGEKKYKIKEKIEIPSMYIDLYNRSNFFRFHLQKKFIN